ncbi:hypothetical protein QCA50_003928 [Cerrena zonata]|uniref:Uncharacterized protein n=1 Tax=Cerrena zonata TaxID=2478898 RepID=A0AAW0GFQ7_9APHY
MSKNVKKNLTGKKPPKPAEEPIAADDPEAPSDIIRRMAAPQGIKPPAPPPRSSRSAREKPIRSPRSSSDRAHKSAKTVGTMESEESEEPASDNPSNPRRTRPSASGPPSSSRLVSAPGQRRTTQANHPSPDTTLQLPPEKIPPRPRGSMGPPPVPLHPGSSRSDPLPHSGSPQMNRAASEPFIPSHKSFLQATSNVQGSPAASHEWLALAQRAHEVTDQIDEYQQRFI